MPYTYTFEDIRNRPVAVIGAGTLGRRIALMFATRGATGRIYARRTEQLVEATQYVTEMLPKVVADRGFGGVGVATAAGSLVEALDGAWLAVESVPEKLEIKIAAWGQIDEAAPPGTIFATNSSSYPSRLMAEKVRDKSRLCNMHFHMPPETHAGKLGVKNCMVVRTACPTMRSRNPGANRLIWAMIAAVASPADRLPLA